MLLEMEVLPPDQSSTRLGPPMSQRTWPAAFATIHTMPTMSVKYSSKTAGLGGCQVTLKVRNACFTICVRRKVYIYVAVLLFNVNTPAVGPGVVPAALAAVPLAAGPAASHRWVCLARPRYCSLLAANNSHVQGYKKMISNDRVVDNAQQSKQALKTNK